MTRLRWRVGVLAAAVAMPTALLGPPPAAGRVCCADRGDEDEVVVSINGTICWEQPPPDGKPTRRTAQTWPPTVTITLSRPVREAVTVILDTRDGTAVAPYDYEAIKGRKVTIPEGARGVEVPLGIRADDEVEKDEWFLVIISEPSIGRIGNGKAEVIIKDGAPPKDGSGTGQSGTGQ